MINAICQLDWAGIKLLFDKEGKFYSKIKLLNTVI